MITLIIADNKGYSLNFSFKSYPSSSRRFDIIARTVLELIWLRNSSIGNFLSNIVYIVFREEAQYKVFRINIKHVPKVCTWNEYAFLIYLIKHGGLIRTSLDEVFQSIKGSVVMHLTENGVEISKTKLPHEVFRQAIVLLGGRYDVPKDFLERTFNLASDVLNISIGSKSYLASHTIAFFTYFLYSRFKDLVMK